MAPDKIAYPCGGGNKRAGCTLLNEIEISCHTVKCHLVTLNVIKIGVYQGNEAGEVIWADNEVYR